MKNEIYDVSYFIKKFEAIPEVMWMTGTLKFKDKFCALGFCDTTDSYNLNKEGKALAEVIKKSNIFTEKFNDIGRYVWEINDGYHKQYQQPTPKQRILAALYDIKKTQPATRIYEPVIVKVEISETISKMSKELIEN